MSKYKPSVSSSKNMTVLPRKELLRLKEEQHPLFLKKRKEFYENNPNSYIPYGRFIATITREELHEY